MPELSDAEIQRLADRAECGYEPSQLRPTVKLTDEQFAEPEPVLDDPAQARLDELRDRWL